MNDAREAAAPWVDALRAAARWRMLGLALECPAPGWSEQLAALAEEIDDDAMRRLAQAAAVEASPELYHTTFGPGGPAAPREVSYAETISPGQVLSELQAFYDAFAYRPAIDEPADHVAVELGFVSYLCLKIAYAQSRGDAAAAEVARGALEQFLAQHLRRIVAPLGRLIEGSEVGYLQAAMTALGGMADFDAPAPPEEALRSADAYNELGVLESCDDAEDVIELPH